MRSSPRYLVFLGVLAALLPAQVTAQAPSPATLDLSSDQLAETYNTAAIIAGSVHCPTKELAPLPEPDLASARTLAHAAAMFDVAARNYPRPAAKADPVAHANKLAALILQATQVYEQAYGCAPGYDQRHHLESARALVDVRLNAIREQEKRPPSAPDYVRLAERRSEIEKLIPQAPQPPPVDPDPPKRRSPPPPPEVPSSYARYAGFLVLRPEIGVGTGRITDDNVDMADAPAFTAPFVNLFAAARFSGRRNSHAFILGGTFNYQRIPDTTRLDAKRIHAVLGSALRLEGALHAHPRWFSFHPAVEIGMQVGFGTRRWGHPYVGPALGLCIDRELACLTVKFTTPLVSPEQTDPSVQMWQVGLGIDLMRIVDRVKGVATP